MGDRIILHSDLNAFYASVECMLNPELKGKPVAVCGDEAERHGIVLAKSEEAKKCGIKTGHTNREALKLCKDLIIVHPRHGVYSQYSKLVRAIYARYTDRIEPFRIDEAWLDITCCAKTIEEGRLVAEQIRNEVKTELGLTVSIGVSFCKIFAKLGSDLKKPDAVTCISRDNFKEKIWPLAASEMIYVGRSTAKKLERYGIHTIGQLAQTPPVFLKDHFGVNGITLYNFANGNGGLQVSADGYEPESKSIGHGTTARFDLSTNEEVKILISELSQEVAKRLKSEKLAARGIQITIKDNDLANHDFRKTLNMQTQSHRTIAEESFELFKERYNWAKKIRAVTVRVINLVAEDCPEQLDLMTDTTEAEKNKKLEDCIESIRSKYGNASINYASVKSSPLFTPRQPAVLPGGKKIE